MNYMALQPFEIELNWIDPFISNSAAMLSCQPWDGKNSAKGYKKNIKVDQVFNRTAP